MLLLVELDPLNPGQRVALQGEEVMPLLLLVELGRLNPGQRVALRC